MTDTYLPSFWYRLWQLVRLLARVWFPPSMRWHEGDVLVVLDAIHAYATLFSSEHLRQLNLLVDSARANRIPIVFTRWSRTDARLGDAVDKKGHWTDYVPSSELILPCRQEDTVADVVYTNAFTSPKVTDVTGGRRRLVLAGGWLESCVIDTARSSQPLGFDVTVVVKPATVGHWGVRTLSLLKLQALYATVVSHMCDGKTE